MSLSEALKMVLDADVNQPDSEGSPSYWQAVLSQNNFHENQLAKLVALGADLNACDTCGNTLLHNVLFNYTFHSLTKGNAMAMIRALQSHNADFNRVNHHRQTALMVYLSEYGHHDLDIVHALIAGGVDVNLPTKDGCASLHLAVAHPIENVDLARVLLEAKADIHQRLPCGLAPLHIATRHENVDTMKVLLEHGADPNHPSDSLGTPLDCARRILHHGSGRHLQSLLEKFVKKQKP